MSNVMQEKVFCSKCGTGDQTSDSYCRQCGEWISDNSSGQGRFRRATRESRIRRLQMLQVISICLSLISSLIIISFMNGGDIGLLNLAVLCGVLVAVYQSISLFIGNKVLTPKNVRTETTNEDIKPIPAAQPNNLNAAATGEFAVPGSVIEDTTNLLEPVPRYRSPKDRKNN